MHSNISGYDSLNKRIISIYILMSSILLLTGLIGFSLLLTNSHTTEHFKKLIKENEVTTELSVNILYLQTSIYEYLLTSDPVNVSEFRFRSAKIESLLKEAEQMITAEQVKVLIPDLRESFESINDHFELVLRSEDRSKNIYELNSIFSFVKNNLEIASNSMKLISDSVDREQNRISNGSFLLFLIILIIEIGIVIYTGLFFNQKILKPLKGLQNLLQDTIDSMPSVLIGSHPDGTVRIWNKSAESETGISADDAKGQVLTDLLPVLSHQDREIRNYILNGELYRESTDYIDKNGKKRFFDVVIYPLTSQDDPGAVIRIDDVTEKHLMQEHMVQSEKILSLGGLAAGMAHEINNPLAGLIQSSATVRRRLGLEGELPANLKAAEESQIESEHLIHYLQIRDIPRLFKNIDDSGKRISQIISNMLSFSRKDSNLPVKINVIDLLEKTIELASTDYDLKKRFDFRNIKIIRNYETDIPLIRGESTKLEQVFFNLLKNGADAMRKSSKVNPEFTISVKKLNKDNWISIDVEDNGPGIEKEDQVRIFEPFFTTKAEGKGTGLGLSLSYFIVTDTHKGKMFVTSELNKGTTFTILLPLDV